MSRSWQNLPYEVLLTIFKNLDQTSDISVCQRACQNWSRAARERLYKEVTLCKFSAVHKFLDCLCLSKHNHYVNKTHREGGEATGTAFGQLVNSLELQQVPNKELRFSFLDAVADLCPHLQRLKGQWNSALWHGLLQQHAKGHLRHLQVIELPIVSESYGDYVAAVLAYRNAIKSVYILGDLPTVPSEQSPYTTLLGKELIKNLGTFSCLTELEIKMETKDEENIMALDHIIDHCYKTLKKIKFTSSESRGRGPARLHPVLKKNLALVQQHPNIQKFYGDGIYMTDECMDYLEHRFPHLQQLTLNDLGEGFDGRASLFELSTIGGMQQSHMGKFFHYLEAITSFKVSGKVKEEDLSAMMHLYTTILNKDLNVKIQYSHHRGIQAYPFMTLIQSPQDPSQKRKKDLNSTHYNRLEANYLLQPRCSDSPSHIEFLNQFGEKIREIYLKTGIDERHEILHGSEFEMAVMSQSLAIILTHCPKLESLLWTR